MMCAHVYCICTWNIVLTRTCHIYKSHYYYSNNSKHNYGLYSDLPPAEKSSQTETVVTNTTATQSDQSPPFAAGRFAIYTNLIIITVIILNIIMVCIQIFHQQRNLHRPKQSSLIQPQHKVISRLHSLQADLPMIHKEYTSTLDLKLMKSF